MQQISGKISEPFLILHGGAGTPDPLDDRVKEGSKAIKEIAFETVHPANSRLTPHHRVLLGLKLLEKHPRFNAGYGSSLQKDGVARLTAAFMDGSRQSFSAVLGATDLLHPSQLAVALQERKTRVLAPPGTERLCRELQIPVESPISPERRLRWYQNTTAAEEKQLKTPLQAEGPDGSDTVGVLLFDGKNLYAGASTGGRGGEIPGRVSDSCTVAGTYASAFAAILATGVGEQIVDDALAARLETRVRDGLSLEEASKKAFREATAQHHQYGWIAADRSGHFACAHTTPVMTFAVITLSGELIACSAPR